MRVTARLCAPLLALVAAAACVTETVPPEPDPSEDLDGDTISNDDEGRLTGRDTDRDGVPDYLDVDADGDSIGDAIEAGDARLDTPPVDSDADGQPDYLDLDSDGNVLPDEVEGIGDLDVDGVPNYADLDDDGDLVPDARELAGIFDPLVDSDGDGSPNHLDPDSDDDDILDGDEHGVDTDHDGLFDHEDLDTDNDTILDWEEAGDRDLFSPPRDTDSDRIPDFRDPDSDDDGLPDALEAARGTDPTQADSDGDGVDDLTEAVAGTDPLNPDRNPRARGDFVFVLPYREAPRPAFDTLGFVASIQRADVYFLMDETSSMTGPIEWAKREILQIMGRIRAVIPDTQLGLGGFRDYPHWPYGSGGRPYEHYVDITDDDVAAMDAVGRVYEARGGASVFEAQTQAVFATASGLGLGTYVPPRALSSHGRCPGGRFGYPCFRPEAVPIVLLITDAPMHNGPGGVFAYEGIPAAVTFEEAANAARAAGVRVLGIGTAISARAHLEEMARATDAVDAMGAPLVEVQATGSLSDPVERSIRALASLSRMDVTAELRDDPEDAVDTAAAFFDHLVAVGAGDSALGCAVLPTEDRDLDGIDETFVAVISNNEVCFELHVRENTTVEPIETPQLFQAQVVVIGDGETPLDTRDVYFLVPPRPITLAPPM